jgi:DNA polymerase-3 subunit beta
MEINLKSLISVLDVNAKVLGGSKIIPAYENILFEIKDGRCSIITSDGKVQVRTVLFIDKEVNEKFAVFGKTFIETLKLSDSETVVLKIKENNLLIGSGKSRYKLPISDGSDYPIIKSDISQFSQVSSELATHIMKASNFDNPNELRLALSGISLRYAAGKICIEASDAHKFYHGEVDSEVQIPSVIVQHAISNIIDSFKSIDKMEVGISGTASVFKNDAIEVTVLNIDEKFPVIPQFLELPDTYVKVNKVSLIKSIKRTLLYANLNTKTVAMKVSEGKLLLSSEDLDYNKQAKDEVELIEDTIKNIEIGFNAQFMIGVLSTIDAEEVYIRMTTPQHAIKINSDLSDTICLVMPMVLQNKPE